MNIEEQIKIVKNILLHAETQLLDYEAIAIETLLTAYEKEKGENVKLRLQDIPLIEGELKTYKDRVKELKQELEKEKEKNKNLEIELEIKKYCKVNELTSDLIYYKNLAREYQGNCISKDKLKEIVDECIPKKENIITRELEYTPNANANSYLTQEILSLLKEE